MYKIIVEIPEGWGVILVVKNWKFRGGGGAYVKFPPWWGYGYFLELHILLANGNELNLILPKFTCYQSRRWSRWENLDRFDFSQSN